MFFKCAQIGFLDGNGVFYVKEGNPGNAWTQEATQATKIFMSGNRRAYIDTTGSLWVKKGGLSPCWINQGVNPVLVALSGNRIAFPGRFR